MIFNDDRRLEGDSPVKPNRAPIGEDLELETLLPADLLRLSDASMRTIDGRDLVPALPFGYGVHVDDLGQDGVIQIVDDSIDLIPIQPHSSDTPTVAVDVSSTRVGETESGTLCAIRGAIVWRKAGAYRYVRCGPLVFHIASDLRVDPTGQMEPAGVGDLKIGFDTYERVTKRLRASLELWLRRVVCSYFSRSMILFDGSLTAGTADAPLREMDDILSRARRNSSVVFALSKETRLVMAGRLVTLLLGEREAPCLLDIDRQVRARFVDQPLRLLGHVYVSRLAEDGLAFRLDIDEKVEQDTAINAAGELAGNDVLGQGYPETLRLAHIFSTFTAGEVLAIQRFVASAYGLRIAPKVSLRKCLFGPFASGREMD